jgi:hypothetical protein
MKEWGGSEYSQSARRQPQIIRPLIASASELEDARSAKATA